MKLKYALTAIGTLALALTSCLGDDKPDDSNDIWKKQNEDWMITKSLEKDAEGNNVYERVGSAWDPNAYVLMRWHNDRSQTASKLSPISTSTVDVRYEVSAIDSVLIDSSHKRVSPAPGVYRTVLSKNISGWVLGISQMHVGDTCTILIPYNQAYGTIQYNGLKPYSNLIFHVRLVDVPAYDKPL